MKEFVKTVVAVICGLLIIQILGFLLFFLMVGSAAISSGSRTVLPREGVLDINMADFTLAEQSQETTGAGFSPSGFSMVPTLGLWDVVQSLDKAAADPVVQYVFLRPDMASGGTATLEELRAALSRFRESGKPVIAYMENPGNASYYLASVADKIYMTSYHGGNPQLVGISGRMIFLKDLLDKVGVNYQLIRHGKYKSAGEMYIKNAPSDENREQNQVMIDGMWKALSGVMASARGISGETFNALIDQLSLSFPEDFEKAGLVDGLLDREGLKEKLCTLSGVSKEEDIHLISLSDYVDAKKAPVPSKKPQVAIIFADGSIVDGDEYQEIAADRFVREIEKVRKEASVKSVVLRVNSPGGSVIASEKIRTALSLLMAEKPLVASYGNYAASGGYWISNGCQKIYSDATTLTGSIGVFSLIPEFSKVTGKVGVNVVTVNSNKHSDMFSLVRPFDQEEKDNMQRYVEDVYTNFVGLVAEGRGMEVEQVDAIAQGRVWVGSDALSLGLVDEIGTLWDAVAYAASLSGLISEDDYAVSSYPAPLTVFEQIMQSFGQGDKEPKILSGTPFEGIGKSLMQLQGNQPSQVYAQLPYSLEIR